jgi:WD40 repeat protein
LHAQPDVEPLLTPLCGATLTPPQVFEYTLDATRKVHSFQAHLDSCRTVKFVGDGSMLLSGSADCSILAMDSTTGQVHIPTSHILPLCSLWANCRAGHRRRLVWAGAVCWL